MSSTPPPSTLQEAKAVLAEQPDASPDVAETISAEFTKQAQENWDWLPFLSNWYEKEYERRYTLENVVITPITLLTGVYGILYVLLTQYDFKNSSSLLSAIFCGALLASLGFAFRSSFYVYKSYAVVKEGKYKNIPDAMLLRKHLEDLVSHYKQNEPVADGTQKFKEYFVDLLAQQIAVNVVNNDDRTENIQRSKKPVMMALLAVFAAMPCFLRNQFTKPDLIHQVSLISQPSKLMSKQATPPPPPPPPPKQREIFNLPKPTK